MSSSGETELAKLLADLRPVLVPDEFVYLTFPQGTYGDMAGLQPLAMVREAEGLTLVVPRHAADAEQQVYEGTFRCITLQVHSSLSAVGLTAAVAATLTTSGISANVIAGYHHDHVLVPAERAEATLAALRKLS